MNKTMFRFSLKAVFIALLAGFLLPASGQAAPQTLRFTCAYMETHPAYVGAIEPWLREVENVTGQALKIRYFSPNTLCPEVGMYDATASGAVHLAANAHGRTPGRFPLAGILDLPMLFPDAETGSVISQAVYEEQPGLREETTGVHILWNYVSAPNILHTRKPVQSLEDLKGMKIIAWAPMAVDVLRALGAIPVQAVPHESYLSIQRGMADGVLCPLSPMRSFKINEAVRYTLLTPLMADSFWMAMSPQTWASLTPEQQTAITATLPGMPAKTGRSLDLGAKTEAAALVEDGHICNTLSEQEILRWQEALHPIYGKFLQAHPDADPILEDIRRRLAEKSPAR